MSRLKQISVMESKFYMPEDEDAGWIKAMQGIVAIVPTVEQVRTPGRASEAVQP